MKLKQLTLENFRGFKKLELTLDPQLTVLVGANGAGKSSVLDAIAILLSRITSRVRGGAGRRDIRELDIRNRTGYAWIQADADFTWSVLKVKQGYVRPDIPKDSDGFIQHVKSIQQVITETFEACSIPLFAYYPINRAVLDVPLRIRNSHEFELLEAWDEALTSASNFRSFFEWFRNQEDIENEISRDRIRYNQELYDGECCDISLQAVRCALGCFLPEFERFSVKRNPLRMVVQKHDQEVRVDQLSDGEKCLIALVADIARRLAIANPILEDPLQGEGEASCCAPVRPG